MAYMNEITRRSDLVERALETAAQMLRDAADRRAENRVYRSTLAELQTLSTRELTDLGLHRSELRRIAREAAQGATAR